MRIRLVTPEFPPFLAGISTWSASITGALREAGHEVIVHARAPAVGEGVLRMPGRSWNRWGSVWAAAHVRPRLRSGDAVVAATWPMAVHLVDHARVVTTWHGSDLTRPPLVGGRDHVIARSAHLPVSDYLGGLLGAPYSVLPYAIRPLPLVPRGEHLLVVARLTRLKGVDRALRLARRLGRDAIVVGDGPERPGLEALAGELGVRANFLGATRDVPWGEAWALALLSRPDDDGSGQEGLGLVLLEAAARGIPSIGSRCGGIPEAATIVLDDPETDDVPVLPAGEAVQAGLVARHSPEKAVNTVLAAINSR